MTRQFGQIKISNTIDPNKTWSNNLFADNIVVMGIAIYAQPGTRFQINQLNDKVERTLVINTLGVFQMDVEDRPITGLFIKEEDRDQQHPIIIDYIYQGVETNG